MRRNQTFMGSCHAALPLRRSIKNQEAFVYWFLVVNCGSAIHNVKLLVGLGHGSWPPSKTFPCPKPRSNDSSDHRTIHRPCQALLISKAHDYCQGYYSTNGREGYEFDWPDLHNLKASHMKCQRNHATNGSSSSKASQKLTHVIAPIFQKRLNCVSDRPSSQRTVSVFLV